MPKDDQGLNISIASGLFVLPYILFSSFAGNLCKHYSKIKIFRWAKFAEIPISSITAIGFFTDNLIIVFSSLFLMGVQSSIYSPAKYGLIRDIGGKEKISFGTGTMEMLTFLGVLMGTYLGGQLSESIPVLFNGKYEDIFYSSFLLVFAIIGWGLSLTIKATEEETDNTNTDLFFISFIKNNISWSKENLPKLNIVILGLAFFWLLASLIQMNLILYCERVLQMSSSETGITQAFLAISIALGSVFTGVVSKKKIKLYFVSIGAIAMIVSMTLIYLLPPSRIIFYILISVTAFSAGVFKVPLNSWLQLNVKGRKLGEILAYENIVEFIFILISAGLFALFSSLFGASTIFLICALIVVSMLIFLITKFTEIRNYSEK